MERFVIKAFFALALACTVYAVPVAAAQGGSGRDGAGEMEYMAWEKQAELAFGLSPGMGKELLTEEQWQEHLERMQGMSKAERQEYRTEIHIELMKEAQAQGLPMPQMPGLEGRTGI